MSEDLAITEKLYGDLAALRRTAAFARGAGVWVQESGSKKRKLDRRFPRLKGGC